MLLVRRTYFLGVFAVLTVLGLVISGLTFAGSASAASDIAPPELVSSSVTPKALDLEAGPSTVTTTVHLKDQTGVSRPAVILSHSTSNQSHDFGGMSLVSGSLEDGIWEHSATIPNGSASGEWEVSLYPLTDTLGNRSSSFQTLETITVKGQDLDTTGPELVSSTVTPKVLNLETGPSTVKTTVHLKDETGVSRPTLIVSHTTTDQSHGFGGMSLVSGSLEDGIWEHWATIPKGSASGLWEVTLYPLSDTLGNRSSSFITLDTITVSDGVPAPKPTPTVKPTPTPSPSPAPKAVKPAPVVFDDRTGTADDKYTIPLTVGVEYVVGKTVTAPGMHKAKGTVKVVARAKTGFKLAAGATAEWSHTFSDEKAPYNPPAKSPFADVSTGQQFYKEMAWLADQKISTGWVEANGTRTYRPMQSINRDAMAAFLYRAAGSPAYTPPVRSPFADVSTGQQFYKEMAWLADQKISTGWVEANGTRTYRPLQSISRDAMAAFLYRHSTNSGR